MISSPAVLADLKLSMPDISITTPDPSFALIAGIMTRFNQSGDIISALQWALPQILSTMTAEAASLFFHHPDKMALECIICQGPVDITGMSVPLGEGIVGRVFATGQAELVADVQNDLGHFNHSDQKSGFVTRSLITAPVLMPEKSFGAIQVINRIISGDDCAMFQLSDLAVLEALANALALAFSHVELTRKAVDDHMLKRDISEAVEAQKLLMPAPFTQDIIAGQVIPARQISGDFFDYLQSDEWLAFCIGDVSGKGMAAGLLMARCLTLFRFLARTGASCTDMARQINDEWLQKSNDRFATMVIGWFNQNTGALSLINCGHGELICWRNMGSNHNKPELIASHTTPIGVITYDGLDEWNTMLEEKASLYMFSDGISEARTDENTQLEIEGVINLTGQHHDMNAPDRVEAVMQLIREGELKTHDDASLLVISRDISQPQINHIDLPAHPTALPKARRFLQDMIDHFNWGDRRDDIQIAVGEVLQNIVRHAVWKIKSSAKMTISVQITSDLMIVEIIDNAQPQHAEIWQQKAKSKSRLEGGMGLELVEKLCHAVRYTSDDHGNQVYLSFDIKQK